MARNKYPEETRRLIVDTACQLFIEKGYEHTSIQDIIDHLGGLSKGAIYHHFRSKEEIMEAAADRMYEGTEEQMRRICGEKGLTGREKMYRIFRFSLENTVKAEIFKAAPDMLNSPRLLALQVQETVQKEAPELLAPILREGVEDGSIQTEYPEEMAEVLMLLGNIWLNPLIYHDSPEKMVSRMEFFGELLKALGADIIDEEMISYVRKFAELYQEHH